jgi:malonyl-CoA O-methyltransferase
MPTKLFRVSLPAKNRIAKTFGLKAARYEHHAKIQLALLDRLLCMIAEQHSLQGWWVDIGCGSGLLERMADGRKMTEPNFVGMDIAIEALRSLRANTKKKHPTFVGDFEAVPFKPGSLGGMVIASVLQWLDDPFLTLKRTGTLLRRKGICAFSIFVNDSFSELFATREAIGLPISVRCPRSEAAKKCLSSAPFRLIRFENFRDTLYFPNARSLLKHLSASGASATPEKKMTRSGLERFCALYESMFKTQSGVPLTWEAVIGLSEKRTTS